MAVGAFMYMYAQSAEVRRNWNLLPSPHFHYKCTLLCSQWLILPADSLVPCWGNSSWAKKALPDMIQDYGEDTLLNLFVLSCGWRALHDTPVSVCWSRWHDMERTLCDNNDVLLIKVVYIFTFTVQSTRIGCVPISRSIARAFLIFLHLWCYVRYTCAQYRLLSFRF